MCDILTLYLLDLQPPCVLIAVLFEFDQKKALALALVIHLSPWLLRQVKLLF